MDGICLDSGQGTPESLGVEMGKLNLLTPFFTADSCGLCDLQSVFRYPVLQNVLDLEVWKQTMQFSCCTLCLLFVQHETLWKSLVGKTAKNLYDEAMDELQRNMNCSMQAPLITRWWSIRHIY